MVAVVNLDIGADMFCSQGRRSGGAASAGEGECSLSVGFGRQQEEG